MPDKHTYDEMLPVILRYLQGTASPEMEQALTDWVESDPDHRMYFVKTKESWMLNEMMAKPVKAKTKSWSELKSQIQIDDSVGQTKVVSLFNYRSVLKIAAGLLLLAAVLFALNNLLNDNDFSYQAHGMMAETILPDNSEVILSDNAVIGYKQTALNR